MKTITTEELKNMKHQGGLILQGCGGDLQEWVDGINGILREKGILLDGKPLEDVSVFQHEGLTNLLLLFGEHKLDMGKLAVWRLQSHEQFGGIWLSDYVENKPGGFADERQVKPDCALIGENGNIFNLMGIGSQTLVERSFRTAFSGFMALKRQSHDDKLQYRLGQMLHTGTGTKKDDVLAAEYWEKAAKLGNVHAQYSLAKLWLETDTGDVSKAIQWLEKAAAGGHAMAQYALGKCYRDGTHVEKSIEQAVHLFLLSAEQKNEYAAYQLGKLYLAGEEIQKDTEKAVKWLKCSAEQGNAYAQYALGKLYLCGEDVPQDMEEALEYFKASADQDNVYASYQLGKLYLAGESVRKDVEAAVRYLERSAANGNQFAQYVLGKLYLQGKDVPRDREKAVSYLEESVAQGNLYAKFLLEHLDSFRDPSPFLAATRLLHHLENLFREDYQKTAGGVFYPIDRKRRRRLAEKKRAQGHKRDDHEPAQRIY